jgi:hypothetical protein
MTDEEFLKQFESCAWPLEGWHHREHVKVAYLYLLKHSLDEAIARIRAGIRAYSSFHNVPEGPAAGYHETMTQAWVRLVHLTLCEYGPAESADTFFEQHPQLSQKKNLRLFYSRDRFMSPEAKREFLEPDLAPLPRSRKDSSFNSHAGKT